MSDAAKGGLIRNTLLYMPAQLLGPLLQFATTIIWTHQLDPVAYGVVTLVVAAQEVTGFVGLTWWTLYVVRFSARHERQGGDAGLRAMDSRMVMFSALAQGLCLTPILFSFQPGDSSLFLVSWCYLVLRTCLMHYTEWARAQNRISLYIAAQVIGPASGALLSMAFIHVLQGGAVSGLAGLAVGQAVALALVMRQLGVRLGIGAVSRELAGAAMRFGWPLIVAAIAAWLASNGIRLLVQWDEGDAAVGLLSVGWGLGQRLASVLAMLCAAAAFPLAVQRIEGGDRAGAQVQIGLNAALMVGILAPAAIGLLILARPFGDILIAEPFRDATIKILPLAFMAMAVKTIKIHTIDQTSLLLERTSVTMWLNLVEAATTLAGSAAGLFFGGLQEAAIGTLAGVCAGAVIAFGYGYRRMDVRFPLGLFARIAMACAAMALVLVPVPAPSGVAQLVITICAGAASYALALTAVIPEIRRVVLERILRR